MILGEGSSSIIENLPFFSKINLTNTYESLTLKGFKVSVAGAQQAKFTQINKIDYLVKNNTSISYYFQEGDEEYDLYLENDYGEIYLKLNENDKVDSILENGCVIIKGEKYTGYKSVKVNLIS